MYVRFRVRTPGQGWRSPGPDLLRRRSNAVKAAVSKMSKLRRTFLVDTGEGFVRVRRAQAISRLNDWVEANARHGEHLSRFRIATGKVSAPKLAVVVQRHHIPRRELRNASPGTILAWSLAAYHFEGLRFAGAYVYKQVSGSSSWSDHAYGTAVDETENRPEGITNDAVTSWNARMAKSGNITLDYLLGSKDGHVVRADRDHRYRLRRSSASDSHLWHVHLSIVDHGGAKPPREGGVW